ncbi:2309_t:CDS:1 [Diversispora eburnea]|uniref:2309_t:CDS:1 n=1 Tax=Diversispora eburnea TaxID=1213867 RepID=A0A9N9AV54_9GLOM|nr:2309_t:CDS:1 [Diversispora eburnea]
MPKTSEKKIIVPRKRRSVHLFETPQFKEEFLRSINKHVKRTYPDGMSVETTLPLDQLLAPCKKTRGKKGRITRPQNAFILYRKDTQAKIFKSNPNTKLDQVSRIVSDLWKNETNQRKNHYIKLSDLCGLIHQDLFPNYKFKPKQKEDVNFVNEQSEYHDSFTNLAHQNQNGLLSSFDINSPISQDTEDVGDAEDISATTLELMEPTQITAFNAINNCPEQFSFTTATHSIYENSHFNENLLENDFFQSHFDKFEKFDITSATNNYEIQNVENFNVEFDPLQSFALDENPFIYTQNEKLPQEFNDYSSTTIYSSSTQTIPTSYPPPIIPITSTFINNDVVTNNASSFLYNDYTIENIEPEFLNEDYMQLLYNYDN